MTLILELPPESEARLRDIARAHNLAPEEAATQALDQWMQQQGDVADEEAKARRREAIKKARGMFKDRGWSSDDFLREKHAEAQRELEKDEMRWRERKARQSETSQRETREESA